MKYFKDVIKGYDNLNTKEITKESLKLEVKSIAYNSKLVKKNYIFVAIKGLKDDGHKYIESAIKNKASIIIYDISADKNFIKNLKEKYKNVCFVGSKNPRARKRV